MATKEQKETARSFLSQELKGDQKADDLLNLAEQMKALGLSKAIIQTTLEASVFEMTHEGDRNRIVMVIL